MEKMFRMCLNWKVIGGLTVVGLAIWLAAPNLLVAALPILLIAACPLSMLLMMKAMGGEHSSQPEDANTKTRVSPSREVRIAELEAKREILDREITALETGRTDPVGAAAPVAERGEGRDHQR